MQIGVVKGPLIGFRAFEIEQVGPAGDQVDREPVRVVPRPDVPGGRGGNGDPSGRGRVGGQILADRFGD